MEFQGYLGYIKYDGDLTVGGVMDGRKQAEALLGFDYALRHFLLKLAPDLKAVDFEIPVKVRDGSWEALIPETVAGWMQASAGIVATAYATQAAQKMAERDFADFGVRDLFSKALNAIKWFARIAKHMGDVSVKSFESVKFSDDKARIGIRNEVGEYIYVPKYALDLYVQAGNRLLSRLACLIEEGRVLKIGSILEDGVDEVVLEVSDKYIFCDEEEEDSEDFLFPELRHGENVVLEGEVTRENKTSNSMGFKYMDHILTSYPEVGSIVRYKQLLFLRCRIFGVIDRIDDKGRALAKRPKIYFSHLEALEHEDKVDLFSGL